MTHVAYIRPSKELYALDCIYIYVVAFLNAGDGNSFINLYIQVKSPGSGSRFSVIVLAIEEE